jgi:hypothetical protein
MAISCYFQLQDPLDVNALAQLILELVLDLNIFSEFMFVVDFYAYIFPRLQLDLNYSRTLLSSALPSATAAPRTKNWRIIMYLLLFNYYYFYYYYFIITITAAAPLRSCYETISYQ